MNNECRQLETLIQKLRVMSTNILAVFFSKIRSERGMPFVLEACQHFVGTKRLII